MQTMGVNEKRWIDETFFCQDLLPGWLWAPMDTATELPELPFRPWNTSVPICGLLNLFLYNTIQYNTNILMLCYMTFQASGIIHILQRRPAKKVKHFVLLLQFIIGLSSTYLHYVSSFSGCWKYDQCKGPSIKERDHLAGLLTKG